MIERKNSELAGVKDDSFIGIQFTYDTAGKITLDCIPIAGADMYRWTFDRKDLDIAVKFAERTWVHR